LEPSETDSDEFYLYPNGSLFAPFLFNGEPLPPTQFCMEVFPDPETGSTKVLPLVCFPEEIEEENQEGTLQFILYPAGKYTAIF